MHRHHHRRSPGRRLAAATVIVAAALGSLAASTAAASPPAEPFPPTPSLHATVVAQGVVQVGTANHVWVLASHAVTASLDLPAGGPTFVVPSSAPVLVRHDGGDPLGVFVEPGEAAFVPAGFDHQLEAATTSDVLEVGVAGGESPDAFALTEGRYDLELVSDVLAPGEALPVSGAVASLVVVTSGAVQLEDGAILPAGYNLPLTGDFTLVNAAAEPTALLVAVLASVDLPAVAGAPLPPPQPVDAAAPDGSTPAGSPTETAAPGSPTPGAPTTAPTSGSPTPGSPTPGAPTTEPSTTSAIAPPTGDDTTSTTPESPGTTAPGATSPSDATTAAPTTPPPTAAPTTVATTTPPTTAAPTTTEAPGEAPLSLRLDSCSGGSSLTILVSASAGDGYRRNVRSVTVARDNEFGNFGSPTSMQWIGEDTAEHDEWKVVNVIGQRQDMGQRIRIVATSDGGQTQTLDLTLSDC